MNMFTRILRRAALLLVLTTLCATVALAAENGFAERLAQEIAQAPSATASNYWKYLDDAQAKQELGYYSNAMTSYYSALHYFAAHSGEGGNALKEINAYRQLADCFASVGEYGLEAAALRAAADRSEALAQPAEAAQPEPAPVSETAPVSEPVTAPEPVSEPVTEPEPEPVSEPTPVPAVVDAGDTELYVKTGDPARGSGSYFGVSGEPVNGFVAGVYAETDTNVHNAYGFGRYWNEFPVVSGVETCVYLIYMDYWLPLSTYESHIKAARQQGFTIELALQPRKGLGSVHAEDLALAQLARDVEASGVQFYIRFAGEMNDASGGNQWYTEDASEYIRAFRAVADAFHTYAPSAAMVWAPNYHPDETIDAYYPGDEYVDIVGVSLYMTYQAGENRRWIDDLDAIYSRYGDRKPIMIAEGAVGFSTADGLDLTLFAVEQLRDFFCYLPIRYPNAKFMIWFDAYAVVGNDVYSCLTDNQTILQAYRDALNGSESFLTSVDAPAAPVYYGRLVSGSEIEDGLVTLCSSYVDASAATVRYAVNGVVIGESHDAPYELTADFSGYRGTNVVVTVSAYYADGSLAGEGSFSLRVADDAPVADPAPDEPAAPVDAAPEAEGGVVYERTFKTELDGRPVTLSTYAIRDEYGNETNYVGLRELAAIMSGTAKQFYVGWDGVAVNVETGAAFEPTASAVKLTGDRPYRVNTAETRINGVAASLESFVLEDDNGGGYVYYKLRDLGGALGFTVDWSTERGIYIEP